MNCSNLNHRDDISKFYDDIIAAMSSGSDTVFDKCHNANRHTGDYSIPGCIGVRANIHLGGQTEFCPNGENNLVVTRPRQGEKIIMNYCSACFLTVVDYTR